MAKSKKQDLEIVPKKMGAPRKELDFDKFDSLCRKGFNQADLCDFFDMNHETINARIFERFGKTYSQYVKQFEAERKQAILDMYWRRAEQSDQILKELGREFLGFGREIKEPKEEGQKIVIEVKGNLLNVDGAITDEITKRIGSVIDATAYQVSLGAGDASVQAKTLPEETLPGFDGSDSESEDS